MKFFVALAAAVMFTGTLFAQEKKQAPTPEQRIEKRTERMQKKLMLDDATAAKFAPIYKDYLKAMGECRPTCGKCENPTDAQIKENIGKRIEAQQKALEVEKKYYKKLSSILSGRQLQVIFCKDKMGKCDMKKFNCKRGNKKAAFNKRGFKKGCFNKCGFKAPGNFPMMGCPKGAPANCPKGEFKAPGKCPKMACPKGAPANCPKGEFKAPGKCPKMACPKDAEKCPKDAKCEQAPAEAAK